jgi:hypothetical protein
LLRQVLMVLVVGLIVARPLVYGGDPGLTDPHTDPPGLVLTFFWLLATAVWSVWRVWARQDDFYLGLVEAGLGAVVLLVFATTYGVAAYRHPARLISWEWLAMLLTLFLVRQLTVSAEEQHGLLAALLAGVVMLSAYGLYEAFEGSPLTRAKYPTVEAMRKDFDTQKKAEFAGKSDDDPAILVQFYRLQQPNISTTFVHPNSFAGYLALLLPALVGAAYVVVRGAYLNWQKVLVVLCAAAGLVALWQTHSRGALLAVALVGLVLTAILFRRWLACHKVATAVGALLLLAAAVALYQSGLPNTLLGKPQATAAVRTEYWRTTWQLIREHPWFGVGPGNFQDSYQHYMSETAGEQIADPHNFALEIWATSGIFALIALLTAVVAFPVYMVRAMWLTPIEEPPPPPPPGGPDDLPPIRWTFYLSGIFGLLMGFVLQASYLEREKITDAAVLAGVGSVIWFAAFALFEQIRWSSHARALLLTGGVAALLINLLVSGGISYPQVATMLWVVVALALNALAPKAVPWLARKPWPRYALVPILLSAAAFYFVGVMAPVTSAKQAMRSDSFKKLEAAYADDPDFVDVEAAMAGYYGSRWSSAVQIPELAKDAQDAEKKALQYAESARRHNPHGKPGYTMEYDIQVMVAKAYQSAERNAVERKARMQPEQQKLRVEVRRSAVQAAVGPGIGILAVDPQARARFTWEAVRQKVMDGAIPAAVGCPAPAIFNDPVKWREYPFDVAPQPDASSNYANYKEQNRRAASILLEYLPNNPNDTHLHFNIAATLYRAEDWEQANQHAHRALELDGIARAILAQDDRAPILSRKLTDRQRAGLEQRLLFTPDN